MSRSDHSSEAQKTFFALLDQTPNLKQFWDLKKRELKRCEFELALEKMSTGGSVSLL